MRYFLTIPPTQALSLQSASLSDRKILPREARRPGQGAPRGMMFMFT
jgi:hypothetical protein